MVTNHKQGSYDILANALSRTTIAITTSNATTVQVAAPGVGKKIVITFLSLVDTSAGAHTCVVKSGTTTRGNVVVPSSGGEVLPGVPLELAENEAFNTTDTAAATGLLAYAICPA